MNRLLCFFALFVLLPSLAWGQVLSASNEDVYVNAAVLADTPLLNFLKNYICPLAKLNNYNPKHDIITVCQYKSEPYKAIYISITAQCAYPPGWLKINENGRKYFRADIDGIQIYFKNFEKKNDFFKPSTKKLYVGKDDSLIRALTICDNSVVWSFEISDDYFRCIYEEDFGSSWLRDPECRKYIPALPYRIMPEELRDIPFIRIETAESPQRAAIPIN